MSDTTILAILEPYGLAPRKVAIVDDCSVTEVYERLRRGEYVAYKDGRKTKITMESIKRRRAGLPLATYAPPGVPGPTIQKKQARG